MRFMIIVKSTGDCAAGAKPNENFLAEMRSYNAALARAGVLIAVDRPVTPHRRVSCSRKSPSSWPLLSLAS